jgi:hypothetical protein
LAVADKKKEVPLAGATAPSYTEAVVNAMVNAALNGVESLVEEESSDEGSSSKGSDSSKEKSEQDGKEEDSESDPDDGSNDDNDYKPDDILVGDKDEEEEELDKKPPVSKSPPVTKNIGVVRVLKKPLSRSSAVTMANSQQWGFDDDIILMLNDEDKVEKLACNSNTGEGMANHVAGGRDVFQSSMEGLHKSLHCIYYLFL